MMKHIFGILFFLIGSVVAQANDRPLPDQLIDLTIRYVRENGPNADVAQFVSMSGHDAWLRRDEFAGLVAPFLKDGDPVKVSGALEVLYRLRVYWPMSSLGDFKKDNAAFFSHLDNLVYAEFKHFHSFTNGTVHHSLALFLGVSPSPESTKELLRIATDTTETDQALICLAWHRDPKDMDALLPFMMQDTQASHSLPYHFRNSYGRAAIPYLQKAAAAAPSEVTRRKAAEELKLLEGK